jgi:hypothetical protein
MAAKRTAPSAARIAKRDMKQWADDVPTCPVEIRAGGEI